jgi:hypothetical protein
MTAGYAWDVFSTLEGYGSYGEEGDWGGYGGKQGPELLESRTLDGHTQELAYHPTIR